MKTIRFYMILAAALIFGVATSGQKKIDSNVFETLPKNLVLKDEVQKYQVITDHINGDIFGHFFNKMRIKGEYTRGLPDGKVKWNNVTVATSTQPDGDFPEGEPLIYMEDFSYKPSEEMLKPEAFSSFGAYSAYAKNLVWDMMGVEGFAWSYWDSLRLNQPFAATNFNGKLDLAGQGSFENKNVVLTWTGVSKRNNELCATIEFRTLNNPLEYAESEMRLKGRSHYWGTIWVSLVDKQIEHAELYEDVTMEMNLPGQNGKQIMDAVREIQFIKLPKDK